MRKTKPEINDQYIVIKMMGIGSITRIFETLSRNQVDFNKVHFYTFSSNRELCEVLEIPQVHYVENRSWSSFLTSLWKIIWQIRQLRSRCIIDFERSSNLLGILRYVVTLNTNTATVSFYDIPKDHSRGLHKQYSLKDRSIDQLLRLSLNFLPDNGAKFIQKPSEFNKNNQQRVVLVNINASDYLPYRKYPQSNFAQVISRLSELYPSLHFELIGSKGEKNYVQTMIKHHFNNHKHISNMCGQWDIKTLNERISSATLLITNDSGPMHIAARVNTKIVAIWGPTSPVTFGYIDNPNIINIESKINCRPCFTHPKSKAANFCDKRIDCMNDIDPEEIVSAANQLLQPKEVTL